MSYSTSSLNRPLLTAVRDFVASEPARFDMGSWFRAEVKRDHREFTTWAAEILSAKSNFERGECGTTACIGGTVAVLLDWADFDPLFLAQDARDALGLPSCELFYEEEWPVAYAYAGNSGDADQAVRAVRLMDDMLAGTVQISDEDLDANEDSSWFCFAQNVRNAQ
jgi:hypothetical protein